MPKIVFMGTPEFAVPPLEALIKAGHSIPLLVCQPDKKKGRGQRVQFPPTKSVALEHGIEVFQPSNIRTPESIEKIASFEPDFCVVIAYGKILPSAILTMPRKACINVHGSLLPAWRGAAPIQFSILNGDPKTGVCTMLMDEEMDTGDVLLRAETDLSPDENYEDLSKRLSEMGADLIKQTIDQFDLIKPTPQDHSQATYTRMLTKEDRLIDWGQKAVEIYRRFNALSPSPGVYTWFRGKRLLIKEMRVADYSKPSSLEPGSIVIEDKTELRVVCGAGTITIVSCQPENKNRLSGSDLINGYQPKEGETLG